MSRPSEFSNTYYQQLLRILGMAASLLPFVVVGLGLLVKFGLLDNRFYAGDATYFALSAGFIVCAAINYYYVFVRTSPPPAMYLALTAAFHILGVLFLLFVSGISSPFLVCWIILTVATDVYFGLTATLVSMVVLCHASLLAFTLHPGLGGQEQLAIFSSVVFIIATSITLSRLRETNDQERIDLSKTRDRAAFQRERLLALVNSMGDAVVTTDQKGIITVYNAATLSLLDTNKDIIGKSIDDVLQLKDAKGGKVSVIEEAHKRRRVFSRSDLMRTVNSEESMDVYLNVAPVQPGYHANGERGYIFILRDITKEKSLEEERDEFISVVSHELRTPIAIAEGTVSNLMILQDRGAAHTMIKTAAKDAHDQILYLAKLVNDLSTLSRAERGVGAEKEVVDLNTTLQETYKEYEPQAVQKGLKLNLDITGKLPQMRTSKLYLEEILQNLITNSLKYTREGTITIAAAKNAKGELHISVKDSGIGISKFDQKRIFQKFYRSEDYRTRETSGTGLGLYVCKKLAEKLHVVITFQSRLNHGSTFAITIPKDQLLTNGVVKPDLPAGFVPTK